MPLFGFDIPVHFLRIGYFRLAVIEERGMMDEF